MKFIENILKGIWIISITFLFSVGLCSQVDAFGTLFHHDKIAYEDKERIASYLEMEYISQKSVLNDRIECFDVSQDETIMVVGYSSHKIGVYDTDGNWKWGIQIIDEPQGIVCEVDDIDNKLLIFFQRSDYIYKIDSELNIIDVVRYNTKPNGEVYPNLELSRPKIRGDREYKMNWTSVWVEENGNKKNLIKNTNLSVIILVFALFIFVIVFSGIIIKERTKTIK